MSSQQFTTFKINKTKKYGSNEIIVNNKSNFKSHLVKCQAIMDDLNFEQCIIKAMGRATVRAINLALQLNSNNYNTFNLTPRTYSVEIPEDKCKKKISIKAAAKDLFNPDEIKNTPKTISYVPAIEIKVRKNDIELNKISKAKKQGKVLNLSDVYGSR